MSLNTFQISLSHPISVHLTRKLIAERVWFESANEPNGRVALRVSLKDARKIGDLLIALEKESAQPAGAELTVLTFECSQLRDALSFILPGLISMNDDDEFGCDDEIERVQGALRLAMDPTSIEDLKAGRARMLDALKSVLPSLVSMNEDDEFGCDAEIQRVEQAIALCDPLRAPRNEAVSRTLKEMLRYAEDEVEPEEHVMGKIRACDAAVALRALIGEEAA